MNSRPDRRNLLKQVGTIRRVTRFSGFGVSDAEFIRRTAASVELALGQSTGFFDETYPTAFNDQSVCGLQRHGYPWGARLKLAFEPGLAPRQEDAYFARIADEKRDALKGRFAQLKDEARKIVGPLQAAHTTAQEPGGGTPSVCATVL